MRVKYKPKDEEKWTKVLNFRVTEDLYSKIKEEALNNNLTLSEYSRKIFIDAVARQLRLKNDSHL